jgi:hypothetical protein
MPDVFLTISDSIQFIRANYDPKMERVKFWMYSKQGWFHVVAYPGNRPRVKKQSIIDAYENPPDSKLYPYRAKSAEEATLPGK